MDIEVEGHGGRVDGLQGVFVPAGASHAFATRQSSRFLVLDIGTDHLDRIYGRAGRGAALTHSAFFPIRAPVRHLLEYASQAGAASLTAAGTVDPWATLLLTTLAEAPDATAQHSLAVSRAVSFMECNLKNPISVSDVARAAGVGERRLYSAFKNELGCTPHAHFAARRLDQAVDLLTSTSLSIAEIAFQTGHADQSALTRALKQARDMTPAAVRRAQGGRKKD